MNPTIQLPTNSVHPARQQRILRLPEVKAKTGFGRVPTLPACFAYSAQNWPVMQPAGQDSPVKICSWLQVAARTCDPQGDTSFENKGRLFIALVRR